jgi:hypothetical protein
MTSVPFRLRAEPSAEGLVDAALATAGAERIGLDGLLTQPGRRAWPAWVRGAAAGHGFRWNLRDTFDGSWWPQGIDVAEHGEHRVLAVSWYAQPVRTVQRGVRLTFVDLRRARWPRYHHVLLVEPVADAGGAVHLDPVVVHAGGIGWLGDRVLVADTFGGLRVFRLDDLSRVTPAPFGYASVLPQHSRYRAEREKGDRAMRFSFVSIEHGGEGARIVAGEYGDGSRADRLARIGLDEAEAPLEVHEPGVYRMQGVCIVDGTWYVTTSNGSRTRGDLWAGTPGNLRRHRHVLPAGPEDLAYDRAAGRLWSLSEWPGRRRVFTIDPRRWSG